MKKLATNVFTDGLVKDFHPLTVPDNVLTDALNATLVTMNGNERVLLNDMGNGRVESAFLPPGYVPIGMKEYGGIIYIAAYNPITNKGLLGSFPSPERNLDLSEISTSPTILELLSSTTIEKQTKTLESLTLNNCLINIVLKTDLFKGAILRSGDKFGLYFEGTNDISYLSNKDIVTIDNTGEIKRTGDYWDKKNEVYRNNLVTLSIEILDANNNLRDFTELLKRYSYDNSISKVILFPDIIAPEDRFNAGYFIQNTAITEDGFTDDVNKERNKKAVNTYNNKLFGKAFLVGKVNTIEYIEVSYKSASGTDGTILEFKVTYFYNTPEKYLASPEIRTKWIGGGVAITFDNNLTKSSDESYDKTTNLYSKIYTLKTNKIDPFKGIVNFLVIPCMLLTPTDTYLLPDISVERSIDLENMNDGTIELTDWRYFYTEEFIQLTWGMTARPFDEEIISNLKFEFYDQNSKETPAKLVHTVYIPDKSSYNGVFTLLIDYTKLLKRHLYIVKISYYRTVVGSTPKTEEFYRTLLTTSLYNNMYNPNHGDYLDDFGSVSAMPTITKYNTIDINTTIINLAVYSNTKKLDDLAYFIERTTTSTEGEETSAWERQSSSFNPISTTLETDWQSLVQYTEVSLTRSLLIENSISNKYPFDLIPGENIVNTVTLEPDWDYVDVLEDLDLLPALDTSDTVFLKEVTDTITLEYENVKSGDTTTFRLKYYFPSLAIFKQELNQSNISVSSLYKSFKTYIYNKCEGLPIIGLVVGNMHRKGGPRDHKYVKMTTCNGLNNSAVSNYKYIGEVYYEKSDNRQEKSYNEFKTDFVKLLEKANIGSNFVLVASPWATGLSATSWNYKGRSGALIDITEGERNHDETDVNCNLKSGGELSYGDEKNNRILGNLYWYTLLCRNTTGEYIMVDLAYCPNNKANDLEEIINKIVGEGYELYFKTSKPTTLSVYKIDLNGAIYNSNYKVNFYGNVSISTTTNGTGVEPQTLFYCDSDDKVYTNRPCITIPPLHTDYLLIQDSITFKYNSTDPSVLLELTPNTKTIYGIDSTISSITSNLLNIPGIIEGSYETSDSNGAELESNMYIKSKLDGKLYDAYTYSVDNAPNFLDTCINNIVIDDNGEILIKNAKVKRALKYLYAECKSSSDKYIRFAFEGEYLQLFPSTSSDDRNQRLLI